MVWCETVTTDGRDVRENRWADFDPSLVSPGFCEPCQDGHCECCQYEHGCYCAGHGHSYVWVAGEPKPARPGSVSLIVKFKMDNRSREIHSRILRYRAEYFTAAWHDERRHLDSIGCGSTATHNLTVESKHLKTRSGAIREIGPRLQCVCCRNGWHDDCIMPGCMCHGAGHSTDATPGIHSPKGLIAVPARTSPIRQALKDALQYQVRVKLMAAPKLLDADPNVPPRAKEPEPRDPVEAGAEPAGLRQSMPEPKAMRDTGDETDWSEEKIGQLYSHYIDACSDQKWTKYLITDMALPGHLYAGKESCGQWKIQGCLEGELHADRIAYIKKTVMKCRNKGCRLCFMAAVLREAMSATDRLLTFAVMKRNGYISKRARSRIILHTVLSPPPKLNELGKTRAGRRQIRDMGMKIIRRFDIDGGVMIDHPYRFTEKLNAPYLSPHVHLVHTGWIDGKIAKQTFDETGWVVKQISTAETHTEVFSLCRYLLTHAAVYVKEALRRSAEHSVRWFGECHNKKFKCADVLARSASSVIELRRLFSKRDVVRMRGKEIPLQKMTYEAYSIVDGSSVKRAIKIESGSRTFDQSATGNGDLVAIELGKFCYGGRPGPPKDNPALPQSVVQNEVYGEGAAKYAHSGLFPPFQFVLYRLYYGPDPSSIVQSVSGSVVLDQSEIAICPGCRLKIKHLRPKTDWSGKTLTRMKSEIVQMREGEFEVVDMDLWDYEHDNFDLLGMYYFDDMGQPMQDPGIFLRGKSLDDVNPVIYTRVSQSLKLAQFVAEFKQNQGRAPTAFERNDFLHPTVIHYKSADAPGQGRLA